MATCLTDNRENALKIGYEATDWQNNMSFDEYKTALSDWDVKEIRRDDKSIGAAYFKDGEVHVSILPKWRKRWVTRGLLKQLFVAKNTFTRIMPGHEYMYDIFHRLGFVIRPDGAVVKGEHCGY
jgi:hypothetical protein